jgi:hypothetical protein
MRADDDGTDGSSDEEDQRLRGGVKVVNLLSESDTGEDVLDLDEGLSTASIVTDEDGTDDDWVENEPWDLRVGKESEVPRPAGRVNDKPSMRLSTPGSSRSLTVVKTGYRSESRCGPMTPARWGPLSARPRASDTTIEKEDSGTEDDGDVDEPMGGVGGVMAEPPPARMVEDETTMREYSSTSSSSYKVVKKKTVKASSSVQANERVGFASEQKPPKRMRVQPPRASESSSSSAGRGRFESGALPVVPERKPKPFSVGLGSVRGVPLPALSRQEEAVPFDGIPFKTGLVGHFPPPYEEAVENENRSTRKGGTRPKIDRWSKSEGTKFLCCIQRTSSVVVV